MWYCKKCNVENEDNFDICYMCETSSEEEALKLKDKPLMSNSKIGSKVEEDFVDAPINTFKKTPYLNLSGLMFTVCFGIQLSILIIMSNVSGSTLAKMSEVLYVGGGVALVFGFFGGVLLMKNK